MRAAIIAAVCLTILEVTLYFGSTVINLTDPGISPSERVMIYAAKNIMPPLLGALLLAGIMAAALSSASTFMSLVGFSFSNDLFAHGVVDEQKMLRMTRLTMLGIGLVALVGAFFLPVDLFWLTYFVGTLFASSWCAVGLMSVWSKRITADAAFWGIVSGFLGNVIPKLLVVLGVLDLPFWLDPVFLGAAISLAVVLLLSRRGTVSRTEKLYRLRLHRTPGAERDPGRGRKTARFTWLLVIYVVVFNSIFLAWYIQPFRQATGDTALGEIIAVLAGPVVWGGTAFFAWRMIRRSYG
jgi:sodium/pantothenate symporter